MVLRPEEAHLVGSIPQHGRGGAGPESPHALLLNDGRRTVQWALHSSNPPLKFKEISNEFEE